MPASDVLVREPPLHGSTSGEKRTLYVTGAVDADVVMMASGHKKPRRSTYIVRKEETHKLLREIETLQERLRHTEKQRYDALAASKRANALLRESVRSQQLSLAASQCVISGLLSGDHSNPLSINHIRLGTDWGDRRETLLAMKARTMQHACEYVATRSQFLDPLKRHSSGERFENANGDFCFAEYDVYQFPNVTSVRQVYDALVSYFSNVEISVSEHLGDITTRDDLDFVDDSIASFRLLTAEFGVPMEKHGVCFMEYFESHELFGGEPCGVFVVDRVEEDELYPYTPQERLRKDIIAAIVLRPHWQEGGQGGGDKELVVSLSVGKFKKLYRSECVFATPEAVEQMRESGLGWGSVMLTTMRDVLYRHPAGGTH